MAILPLQLARVSTGLKTSLAQRSLTRTQQSLLEVQNQLVTGKRLNAPSDDPGDAAIAQQIRKTLEQQSSYLANLKQTGSLLNEYDSTLGDLGDLLRDAQTLASANVGSDVTVEQRQAASAVVASIYSQVLNLANKQSQGVWMFAGDAGSQPFVMNHKGVTFVGSETVLSNTVDRNTVLPFMVDGNDVFGAMSSRVRGSVDLTPAVTASTRLVDMLGANGEGVGLGSIEIGNGTVSGVVDLSTADTLGDVVDLINAAGIGSIAASIDGAGRRLILSGGATDDITINELGGTTAGDLGILQTTGGGAGLPVNGSDLEPTVTRLTQLADLRGGAGIDLASGMTIRNGTQTTTIDLSTAVTVEDLLNRINSAGVGVSARINADGTGIDILNALHTSDLMIGENGGTTAADLGIRSYSASTQLSELNNGAGVRTVAGADIQVTRRDGTTFQVDLSNLSTVQDVIDAINTADGGGGVTASFSTTGNGIILTDSTAGAGTLAVTPVNFSLAADDLGLRVAASGTTLTGDDVNGIRSVGLLGNLASLRDALSNGTQQEITAAAEGLQVDLDRVIRTRGEVGARVQEFEARQERLEDQELANKSLLSQLEDADYNEAITRFQSLQTALSANLQTTGRLLSQTLLDFLQ